MSARPPETETERLARTLNRNMGIAALVVLGLFAAAVAFYIFG